MADNLDDKISRLPTWVRELIRDLRVRAEPNIEEMVRLRRDVSLLQEQKRQLQDRIDAMVSMFQCAAKGENEIAKAVQRIVEDFLVTDEE